MDVSILSPDGGLCTRVPDRERPTYRFEVPIDAPLPLSVEPDVGRFDVHPHLGRQAP
jgi:hypothetical protein